MGIGPLGIIPRFAWKTCDAPLTRANVCVPAGGLPPTCLCTCCLVASLLGSLIARLLGCLVDCLTD